MRTKLQMERCQENLLHGHIYEQSAKTSAQLTCEDMWIRHPKRAGWQDAHPNEHRNQREWRRRWVVAAQGLFSQTKDFGFCSKCEEKSRKTAGRCHETPFVLIILPAVLNKDMFGYFCIFIKYIQIEGIYNHTSGHVREDS